jgi:hypothetical protein
LDPRGRWIHHDIAAVLNMLRRVVEKLKSKYIEAVKQALFAVDVEMLKELTEATLKAERPDVRPGLAPPPSARQVTWAPVSRP